MDPDYLPFHPSPSKPTFRAPEGAVDAHCHVFGPTETFPYAPERKYTPCDAPKAKLFELRDYLGFSRNVIVQASATAGITMLLSMRSNHLTDLPAALPLSARMSPMRNSRKWIGLASGLSVLTS